MTVAQVRDDLLGLAARGDVPSPVGMFYGGSTHGAASGRTFESLEPATGRVLANVADGDGLDLARALESAEPASIAWGAMAPRERAELVDELGRRVIAHADAIGLIDARDTGSPVTAMRADALKGGRALVSNAGLATELKGDTLPLPGLHYTRLEPWGVVARIIAFNHPGLYACSRLGPALVAGNSVILKPSELASLAPLAIAELSRGLLPDGVLSVLTGGPALGAAIAAHATLRRLSFTGSVATALRIQAAVAAAGTIKHVTLELGGKNPILVFPDADLEAASRAVVRGMNFTRVQGQSCGSTSRLLVHRDVSREVIDRVLALVGKIRLGDPTEESTEMGTLISRAAQARCLGFVERAVDDGARLLVGGTVPKEPAFENGAYVLPTVLDEVIPESELAEEEVFGPVLAISTWTDEDDAIRQANAVRYGLTASVWTSSLDRAIDAAHRLEAGYIWVNDVESRYPGVPFGGWKDSGLGLEHGIEELLSFSRVKAVNITIP